MKAQRVAQKYWFDIDETDPSGIWRAKTRTESLDKLNLTNYESLTSGGGFGLHLLEEIEQNAQTRFSALCGYRNSCALEMDTLAKVSLNLIKMDEMRVAGFDLKSS